MFSLRNSLPFLATLLLPDLSFAAGIKRQTAAASSAPTATSGVPAGPTTTLQPVLPPNNNSEDFGLLSPDTSLTLHYGGVTNSTASKRDDTNSAILVNLDFVFLYPSVALDYSTFISGVSCTGNNTLVGLVSTSDAYSYIKTAWNGTDNILLITSAGGCGGDNQNDVFLAQSIEFDDAEQSFTATGEEHLAREVASTTDITWGNVIPSKLKKRAHRTLAGSTERLQSRSIYQDSYDLTIGLMLADQEGMSVDPDAPWDNAVLLTTFGPEEDNSTGTGGDGEEKRRRSSTPMVDLSERDGLEYGLKLYCVDCGVQGTASASGALGIDWLDPFDPISKAEITLTGSMYAGLFLGLEMFAEYSQTFEKNFLQIYLNPWDIVDVVEFGPYISIGVEATIDIQAQGTLLLGASATWSGFEATMDFLHPDQSTQTGFEPAIQRKAEAAVELSATATLGLPMGIGFGISVADNLWSADIQLTDTPALTASATFEASASDDSCQGSGCNATSTDDSGDENNGCQGGIYWSVGFTNTLALTVTDLDPYNIDVYSPPPLAAGCINLLGGQTSSGDNSTTGGSCTPGVVTPVSSSSAICGLRGAMLLDHSPRIGPLKTDMDLTSCAARCLGMSNCASFGFNDVKQTCRMYSASVSGLQIKPSKKSNKLYYDVSCYEPTTCNEAS